MSGRDYPGVDLDKELQDLKDRMAEESSGPSDEAQTSERPPEPESVEPPKPGARDDDEAQRRLAALKKERTEGVPADLPAGQPEMTEAEVRDKLDKLKAEMKSGTEKKKKKGAQKKLAPPSDGSGDILRDMAKSGGQAVQDAKDATKEMKKTDKGSRTLLDRMLGRNK